MRTTLAIFFLHVGHFAACSPAPFLPMASPHWRQRLACMQGTSTTSLGLSQHMLHRREWSPSSSSLVSVVAAAAAPSCLAILLTSLFSAGRTLCNIRLGKKHRLAAKKPEDKTKFINYKLTRINAFRVPLEGGRPAVSLMNIIPRAAFRCSLDLEAISSCLASVRRACAEL